MNSSSSSPFRFSVHATPNARQNLVGGQHDGALRVSVTAVADKGKANKAIVKLLAGALGLRRGQLELVAGQTSRRKTFAVTDPPVDLAERIVTLSRAGEE